MNERIKELYSQAMLFAQEKCEGQTTDMHGNLRSNIWTEKFAELIVRECIAQCEEVAVDADKTSKSKFVTDAGRMLHEGMWGGAKSCSGRIESHFGVEE